MIGPVLTLCGFLVGIPALIGLVFNLPLGRAQEESGTGMLSERHGAVIVSWIIVFFGDLLLLVAIRGLFVGRVPTLSSKPSIHFATDPANFVFTLAMWAAAGLALIWVSRKVRRGDSSD